MRSNELVPLTTLSSGEVGVVQALVGGLRLRSRLATLGFIPGARLMMMQNFGYGPLIVNIRDTRIALGRGEAMKVLVKRMTNDR